MNDATIAVKEKGMPVLEEIKDLKPAYIWKTGTTFYVSKKEWVVAEEWLKTRSYSSCARALKKEGFTRGYLTACRWLRKQHVKDYLNERMEEAGIYAGWTKEHWYKRMTDHISGKERLKNGDLYAMKLLAEYKGWGSIEQNNNNVQINFLQANGQA